MASNNEKIIASTLNSLNLSSASGFRNLGDYLKDVNINLMGKEILSSTDLINKFATNLVNRIGRTYIKSNFYSNGLGDFKKEKTPLGVAVQDIFINTFQPTDWDFTDTGDLIKYHDTTDIVTVYYTVNSQKKYSVSIAQSELQKALIDFNTLNNLVNTITSQLMVSQEVYEWNTTKELLGRDFNKAVSCGIKQKIEFSNETFAQDFVKQCRNINAEFQVPSSFNNNFQNYSNSLDNPELSKNPLTVISKKEDINIIMRMSIKSVCDVDVNAVSFNPNSSEILGKQHLVDNFGVTTTQTSGDGKTYDFLYSHTKKVTNPENGETSTELINYYDLTSYTYTDSQSKKHHIQLQAVICDDSFIHISDQYSPILSTFYNPSVLVLSAFLHSSQRFGLCPFANAKYLYTDEIVE